ncbi:MAG TPA: hypothetical protein DEB39_07620 [Planctomycetaceae bacterium]|nr:hypothetical protein [Planctomycetaceae bacterium]
MSGHHGVSREGELVVFDPARGRKEAEGVVQRIPGHAREVEPVIMDQLVDKSWPKFLFPYPLDENYYLVSCKLTSASPWGLYLVDVFDNLLKLREDPGFHLLEPTPLVKRPAPTLIPPRVNLESPDATVFVADAYFGEGLKNVPPGTVKKMRLFAYSFGYRGIGGHDVFGVESCWDARRIIGEVPVYEDGSAMYTIPANTAIAMQPLDKDGKAVQIMRSWVVGMPGEIVSCVGCHESQNSVTPSKNSIARTKRVSPITPFLGPERPFNFENEVQPVLDTYCAGCHDGEGDHATLPNFKDNSPGPQTFSKSYHALMRYVRRPGPESDVYMFNPMEYHASTSELIFILEKGHHNVRVDHDSMRKIYAWIDLNAPYYGTWLEVAERLRKKGDETKRYAERHNDLKKLYANVDLDFESESYLGFEGQERPAFQAPEKLPKPDRSAPTVPNWPFDAQVAKQMQGGNVVERVMVGDLTIDLAYIPPGEFVMGDEVGMNDELPRRLATVEKPFRMATTEVSNALYGAFDPKHDSRYIDQWWKDHTTPGYPANKPEQPVIRVSWNEANDFCKWLSEKTGRTFRLPTETEWEWACRAGTRTPMWYGDVDTDFGNFENMADESTRLFVVKGVNPQPVGHADWEAFIPRAEGVKDGQMIAEKRGAYAPNPWGLYDMHGSVSEFVAAPGPDGKVDGKIVVKGGSWNDRPKYSRSGIKRYYEPWQKVHNVGIRLVCEP